MPNFTSQTAVARSAVAPLNSAVNMLERLKDISERAEEIHERLLVACNMAQCELDVFEPYDLGGDLNARRKWLEEGLLEIEIAAHDLDELVVIINKLMS